MASGQADPLTFPQEWDFVRLGTNQVPSPGVCVVGAFKRAHEWDVKRGKGSKGGTMTYVGQPPAKGSIKFMLWTQQHFLDWETFRPLFKYDATKKAVNAVPIYHPSLADIDLSNVVCESIGNIVHAGQGLYELTVELIEYLPPPPTPAVSTATGSTGAAGAAGGAGGAGNGRKTPGANDDVQQQIAEQYGVAQQP